MATKKTAAAETATPVKGAADKVSPPVPKAPAKSTSKPAPAAGVTAKKPKHKVKVVRDSFTMPEDEYRKIAEIKEACAKANQQVKKSEVLRAGLKALAAMSPAQLKKALSGLEKVKTGRPKKP